MYAIRSYYGSPFQAVAVSPSRAAASKSLRMKAHSARSSAATGFSPGSRSPGRSAVSSQSARPAKRPKCQACDCQNEESGSSASRAARYSSSFSPSYNFV